jgi:hypothetical protein
VSAFEEMKNTGQVGHETFNLFAWNVPSSARRYGFPPPPGATAWSPPVCAEWVLDLFNKKGAEVAVKLFTGATDEASFTRLVRRTIENEMKDQAKATEAGKMRSRMRTLLPKEDDFVDATALYAGDPAWTLAGHGEEIYTGDWEDLLTAPELKAIEPIQKLNTAGPTSRENIDKLVGAARVILQKAGGAVRDQVLATALVKLFELDAPDIFLVRDDDVSQTAGKPGKTPEGQIEAIEAADAIIVQLSPDEAMALLVLDQPLAAAKQYLPHVTDLAEFLDQLRVKMQAIVDPTDLPPGSLDYVLDWGRQLWDQLDP